MDLASRMARRLAVLPEATMREAVLVEALAAVPAADAVAALAALSEGAARDRNPTYLVAIAALAGALERLPYGLRRDLYEAAKAVDASAIARLFFQGAPPPARRSRSGPPAAPPAPEPAAPAPEQYVPGAGRSISLGERKTLARGGRRELVTALLRDPDASVIHNLLENPRLTEKDVVTVAARRPVRGEVLRRIFTSRWCARYHVKRALVLNPHTPGDVAVRLVWALAATDLKLIVEDVQLAEPVRAQARLALGGKVSASSRPP